MTSQALGVTPLPGAVEEAYQQSVDIGVPTDFNSKGQAVLTSPAHRRNFINALRQNDPNMKNLHDRNCFN